MTIVDLKIELEKTGIPSSWYLLEEKGNEDMRHCISQLDNMWCVYFSERGNRFQMREFSSEADACQELLSRMIRKQQKRR